jgi:fimbrial isopeptide formation D2 family protein/LPXTG-motif cell wall-anchored protein
MKKTNRFLAAMTASLLALTPLAATGMTAFATGNIGVINISGDSAQHTYKAYPIITGTQDSSQLKNLSWASGFNSSGFITALNNNDTRTSLGISTDRAVVPDIVSVDDAAKVLTNINSDYYSALAELIGNYKGSAVTGDFTYDSTSKTYTKEVADGWYLIMDETNLTTSSDVKVKSANILEVVGVTNMNAKHNLPTLDKVIKEGSTEKDANSAAIGDVITYNIKLNVPDVRGYDKYFYVVEDTLSSGLTYNNDLAITVAGETVTQDTDGIGNTVTTGDYYVTAEGTSIKVVFKDAVNYFKNKTVDAPIIISYTATLDSDAVIGDNGNPNKAKLIYSNDPNATGTGTNRPDYPDEPGDTTPKGETPEDTVITYTTAIQVNKVDDTQQALKGAVFTLTSSNYNEVKIVSGYKFEEDTTATTEGMYYKLKDGSYTKTAPVTGGASANPAYDADSISKKYKKVYLSSGDGNNQTIIENSGAASNYAVEAQVDENGTIKFEGLKPGTYTLHELTPPAGYNAAADVEIIITEANDTNGVLKAPSEWTCSGASYVDGNNAFSLNVVNRFGATLPSTGGMGTKLLYIFGSVFAIGSATFIVTRKRVNNSK